MHHQVAVLAYGANHCAKKRWARFMQSSNIWLKVIHFLLVIFNMDVKKEQQIFDKFCVNLKLQKKHRQIFTKYLVNNLFVFMWHAWFKGKWTAGDDDNHTGKLLTCSTPVAVLYKLLCYLNIKDLSQLSLIIFSPVHVTYYYLSSS